MDRHIAENLVSRLEDLDLTLKSIDETIFNGFAAIAEAIREKG